ncbi:MAG: hypothetical protein ACLP36_07900 [Acidimicrobiales bacterium]
MTMTDEQRKQARKSFAKMVATDQLSKIAAVADSLEGSTIIYKDGTEDHGRRTEMERC